MWFVGRSHGLTPRDVYGVCWFKSHTLGKKCYDVMWITLMYSKVPHTILNSGLSRQDW